MNGAARYVVLIGRALFALIFINAVRFHFQQQVIEYAAQQGVPAARILVPLAA